mgnify:CR=1 FL=1
MYQWLNYFIKNDEGYWVASETSQLFTASGWVQYEVGVCLDKGDALDVALALHLSKLEIGLGGFGFSHKGIFILTGIKTIH